PGYRGSLLLFLLESLQELLRLLDVALRVRVLWVQLEHQAPLGDGLLQLLLAVVADALAVMLVDEAPARVLDEGRRILVARGQLGEIGEAPIGGSIVLLIVLGSAHPVEDLLLQRHAGGIPGVLGEIPVDVGQGGRVLLAVQRRLDSGQRIGRRGWWRRRRWGWRRWNRRLGTGDGGHPGRGRWLWVRRGPGRWRGERGQRGHFAAHR